MKCANTSSPTASSARSRRKTDRQRLVVIVFADEHDAPRAIARLHGSEVVLRGE
jgi:hypothetical protein